MILDVEGFNFADNDTNERSKDVIEFTKFKDKWFFTYILTVSSCIIYYTTDGFSTN